MKIVRRLWLAVVGSCAACALFTDVSGLSGAGDGGDAGDAAPQDSGGIDAQSDAPDAAVDAPADAPACAPLGLVQSASTAEFSPQVTTVSTTFQQPTSDGDYVVVGLNYEGACGAVAAVTDTMGNSYGLLASYDSVSGALVLDTWGAHVTGGDGGLDTITAQLTSACDLRNVKAVELRGVDPAFVGPAPSASAKGTGGAPDASLVTSGPSLLFAHTGDQNQALAPGAGWTKVFIDGWATLAEYEIVEAGTYPVAFEPDPSEQWAILAVAVRGCP